MTSSVAARHHVLLLLPHTMTCGSSARILADLASALTLLVAWLVVVGGALLLLLLLVVGVWARSHHEVALAWEVRCTHWWVVVATHWRVLWWCTSVATTVTTTIAPSTAS